MLQPSCSGARYSCLAFSLSLGLVLGWSAVLCAETPLHQRIDELITAGNPNFAKLAAPLASDAEFLRRIYLDLAGTIPTARETRAFLADASANKRQQLIDRLLA